MSQPSQYDAEIAALDAQITSLSTRLAELRKLKAEEVCPFKVGDIVERDRGLLYARNRYQRARVSCIRYGGWRGYNLFGVRIRKDGSDGREVELWGDWKKVEARP